MPLSKLKVKLNCCILDAKPQWRTASNKTFVNPFLIIIIIMICSIMITLTIRVLKYTDNTLFLLLFFLKPVAFESVLHTRVNVKNDRFISIDIPSPSVSLKLFLVEYQKHKTMLLFHYCATDRVFPFSAIEKIHSHADPPPPPPLTIKTIKK